MRNLDFEQLVTGGWSTEDELKFLFGSPSYAGLVNRDVGQVNRTRYLMGLQPITHRQLIQNYLDQLDNRRFPKRMNPAVLRKRVQDWLDAKDSVERLTRKGVVR